MATSTTRKMALVAASAIAIAAYGSASAQEVEPQDDGAVETVLTDEQPPLEGDSPFVDDQDVAESELDEPQDDLDDPLLAEDETNEIDEPLVAQDEDGAYDDGSTLAEDSTGLDEPMMQEDSDPLVAEGDPAYSDSEVDALTTDGSEPMMAQDELEESDDPMLAEDEAADETDPMMAQEDDLDPMTDETEDPALAMDESEDAEAAEEETQLADSEPLPAPDAKIPAEPTDPEEAAVEGVERLTPDEEQRKKQEHAMHQRKRSGELTACTDAGPVALHRPAGLRHAPEAA